MASYIYMKVLESRPRFYDRGIYLLSFGRSEAVKKKIVEQCVEPGFNVLEIGCGTGTMSMLAAKKGAKILGFDVSNPMLQVARKKIGQAGLSEEIELWEMGVSGMDKLEDQSFDLVMSTLVFSELSRDEQRYALKHAMRILKPNGRLAIADEARPESALKRLLHIAVRLPLLIITLAITQTSTIAVEGLRGLLNDAGFSIEKEERSAMDSFIYMVARKHT
jgi:demethylmenaquinone methyltransferase/2-methoxy-6-polyprenyl-1,4-benzoquinol methylase